VKAGKDKFQLFNQFTTQITTTDHCDHC
jgi:hypothetical protein